MDERKVMLKDSKISKSSLMVLVKEIDGTLVVNIPLAGKKVVFDLVDNSVSAKVYLDPHTVCDNIKIF